MIPQKRQSVPSITTGSRFAPASVALFLAPRSWRRSLPWGRFEPAGEGDRVSAARNLAGIDRGLDLSDDPSELRSGLDVQRRGELVAGNRRSRGTVPPPVERGPEHLA